MASTRLAGHGLQSEGRPYVLAGRDDEAERWVRADRWEREGAALCECGWTSAWLESNGQRQRSHREHKETIRNGG
jgi:hypothetical protein